MKTLTRCFAISLIFLIAIISFASGEAAFVSVESITPTSVIAPGSIVRFEHLTSQHGLSQNAGLSLFQDSRGYLWFGTQDGLNRYDGYSFRIFKHDPDDENSLSYNSIISIDEDIQGNLWNRKISYQQYSG